MSTKKFPKIICFRDEDDAEDYDRDPVKWKKLRKLEDLYEDDRISREEYFKRYNEIKYGKKK